MSVGRMESLRTSLITVGVIIGYSSGFFNSAISLVPFILGAIITLIGCYLWTRLKNRSPLFILWGFLAPIGLLGISLLNDKTPYEKPAPKSFRSTPQN
jgi:hypothetical protein